MKEKEVGVVSDCNNVIEASDSIVDKEMLD
jgi:hypothetical protein